MLDPLIGTAKRKAVAAARRALPIAFNRRYEALVEVRIHWVRPSEIRLALGRQPGWNAVTERVLGGDWDRTAVPFEALSLYKAFHTVFKEGGTWSGTPFFQEIVATINGGHHLWGCKNEDELKHRLTSLNSLWEEM